MQNIEIEFIDAASRRGLIIRKLLADGKLHRCDVDGKNGRGDGVYILHLDSIPAGGFQNHKDGLGWQTWKASSKLPEAEYRKLRALIASKQERRGCERKSEIEQARLRAAGILAKARPADAFHPYLRRKQIKPHGLLEYRGAIVVPLTDKDGQLANLQFIQSDGQKRFLRGGLKGGCWHMLGETDGAKFIAISEGIATAASVHEATGLPVAIAFDAGNLVSVAMALKATRPDAHIIVCGDDDWKNPTNPGATKAREAGIVVNGYALPHFGKGRKISDTDFNDLAVLMWLDEVGQQIRHAINAR